MQMIVFTALVVPPTVMGAVFFTGFLVVVFFGVEELVVVFTGGALLTFGASTVRSGPPSNPAWSPSTPEWLVNKVNEAVSPG
jgi:small neutral amino acid transporter SnatA (MarC family)